MAHKLVHGVDRMASTRRDTVWHATETEADGRLVIVAAGDDAEGKLLRMAGTVWPANADNDVAGTAPLYVDSPAGPVEVPSHVATVSPTGRVLGVVGAGYNPVPFRVVLGQWLAALARKGGRPETLGTFDEGRSMFASMQVADSWRVPGDHSETRPLFNVVSNHTGEGGIRGSFATFRVVCSNTSAMYVEGHDRVTSAAERARRAWVSIAHTANARERIEDAVRWIVDGRARAESERALLDRLASKVVGRNEVARFMDQYIALPADASKRTLAIRDSQRDAFYRTMRDAGDLGDHALDGRGITAYGLLQSVTHFEDHVARAVATPDAPVAVRRAFRAFLGEREAEKATARDMIVEMAGR